MSEQKHQAASEKASDTVSIEIGGQYHLWLAEFVAKQGNPTISERRVIEKLLHYLKVLPEKDQQDIIERVSTRPINLPANIMIPSGPTL